MRKIDWHTRFSHQLKWTVNLRDHIYNAYSFENFERLLEIGCGTGALLEEIGDKFPKLELFGIDILSDRLTQAKSNLQKSNIVADLRLMNSENVTFEENYFDIIVTNLMLLWVKDLSKCCQEVFRILKPNGLFVVFSEPDYGGMIEQPETGIKSALIDNLKGKGADPMVGRKLSGAFTKAGFQMIDQYSSSVPWTANTTDMKSNLKKELEFFKALLPENAFNQQLMLQSIENGSYFLFNPTFTFILKKSEEGIN